MSKKTIYNHVQTTPINMDLFDTYDEAIQSLEPFFDDNNKKIKEKEQTKGKTTLELARDEHTRELFKLEEQYAPKTFTYRFHYMPMLLIDKNHKDGAKIFYIQDNLSDFLDLLAQAIERKDHLFFYDYNIAAENQSIDALLNYEIWRIVPKLVALEESYAIGNHVTGVTSETYYNKYQPIQMDHFKIQMDLDFDPERKRIFR